MKYYIFLLSGVMLLFAGCTTQYQAKNYDDVYYSAKDKPVENRTLVVKPHKTEPSEYTQAEQPAVANEPAEQEVNQPANVDSEQYTTPEGNTYINNNFYSDDYYDYAYSSRLRRFHNNFSYNSYYSDYYTNSYWYDYDPWNWGVSIYMGYNWWYPSYYSRWYSPYYSWGFGNYGWWDPYPYYGWGSYGYGYNMGYWNGYYDGYYGGYWGGNYYYNSFDDNSHHYGHRNSVGGSGSIASNTRGQSFSERYENRIAQERNNNGGNSLRGTSVGANSGRRSNSQENLNGIGAADSRRNNSQDAVNRDISQIRPATNDQGAQRVSPNSANQRPTRYVYQGSRNNSRNQNTENLRNQGSIQPYSSPAYAKPRSGQEYTAPKYRNATPSGDNQNGYRNSSNNGTYQAPARQENRSYTEPSNNNSRNYQPNNTPQRSNTYSAPNRGSENRPTPRNSNYSSPGRSNESPAPSRNSNYSAPNRSSESSSPSRSNSSYSSPSRSSESSSPSRSSGSSSSSGSGSGHRR